MKFVEENRETLIQLEEAYVMNRYGSIEYSFKDVQEAVATAKSLLKILEEVYEEVKSG